MHQTKKDNQWYFGMETHIGAGRVSNLVHAVLVTAANVADIIRTAELLREEAQVHADADCLRAKKPADGNLVPRRSQACTAERAVVSGRRRSGLPPVNPENRKRGEIQRFPKRSTKFQAYFVTNL